VLHEAAGQLRVELAARWEAGAELEAPRTSVAQVKNLVLGSIDGPSSPPASMSAVVEQLEGQIYAIDANCNTLILTRK
jgi:hypothetical protein